MVNLHVEKYCGLHAINHPKSLVKITRSESQCSSVSSELTASVDSRQQQHVKASR